MVAAVVAVALVTAAWWYRQRSAMPPVRRHAARHLDPIAFHTEQAIKLGRARATSKHVSGKPVPWTSSGEPPSHKWPKQGLGVLPNLGSQLLEPACVLGPGELCAALADPIHRCDAGDARACLDVGQLLAETPPRPLIASAYFLQACRIGDALGCARLDELKPPSDVPCEQDPFACGWQAYRSKDRTRLDEACALGMADACVVLADLDEDDVDASHAYLALGCQLGSPPACLGLAERLAPGCTPNEQHRRCYAPDELEARRALEIACGAGWAAACSALPVRRP